MTDETQSPDLSAGLASPERPVVSGSLADKPSVDEATGIELLILHNHVLRSERHEVEDERDVFEHLLMSLDGLLYMFADQIPDAPRKGLENISYYFRTMKAKRDQT